MTNLNILRASQAGREQLPDSPVGLMELTDGDLAEVGGGRYRHTYRVAKFGNLCIYKVKFHLHFGWWTISLGSYYFLKWC